MANWIAVIVDIAICYFVAMEYYESKELNAKLNKVYKTKKKKMNATQLVKAVVAQEAEANQ